MNLLKCTISFRNHASYLAGMQSYLAVWRVFGKRNGKRAFFLWIDFISPFIYSSLPTAPPTALPTYTPHITLQPYYLLPPPPLQSSLPVSLFCSPVTMSPPSSNAIVKAGGDSSGSAGLSGGSGSKKRVSYFYRGDVGHYYYVSLKWITGVLGQRKGSAATRVGTKGLG